MTAATGSMEVTVAGGVARLAAGLRQVGRIAASTATMARVVQRAVAADVPVCDVAAAASATPARVLGIDDRTGALRPGLAADLVALYEEFRPRAVMTWPVAALSVAGRPRLRAEPFWEDSAQAKGASVKCHLCVMPYQGGNTGQLA